MGQRSQVPRGPQGADLGDDRGDAGVEQADDGPDDLGAHTGQAGGERAGAEDLHGPDHLDLDRRTHSGGVAGDQRLLDTDGVPRRDPGGGQGTEPGGDAVDRAPVGHRPLDHGSGGRHCLVDAGVDLDPLTVAGHRHHLVDGQRAGAEQHTAIVRRAPSSTRRSYAGRRRGATGVERWAWATGDGRRATGVEPDAVAASGRSEVRPGVVGPRRGRRRVGVPVRAAPAITADRGGRRGLWPTGGPRPGLGGLEPGGRWLRSLGEATSGCGLAPGEPIRTPESGRPGATRSTSSTWMAEQLEPFTPRVTASCDTT